MILKVVAAVLFVVIVGVLGILAYSGLFNKVEISKQEVGPYVFAYLEHKGSYYDVNSEMTQVYEGLKAMGVETQLGIGIYYDNPQQVAQEDLRSEVGSIINEADWDKLDQIKQQFKVKKIEKQSSDVAHFEAKTPLSYMIAPLKVYPAFGKYLEAQGMALPDLGVEIYDVPNKKILYVMIGSQTLVDVEEQN